MKKINILLSIFLLTISYVTANETTQPQKTTENPHHLFVGPDIFWQHENYRESTWISWSRAKMHTVYYGVKAGYEYLTPNAFYAGLDGMYARGRTHFHARFYNPFNHGEFSSHGTSVFANIEGRGGYTFHFLNRITLTPFVGIGGYHIRPHFIIKIKEDWLYGAAGVRSNFALNHTFDLGLNLKGMYLIDGTIKTANETGHFHDRWSYEVDLPLKAHLDHKKQWDAEIEPYYLKLNSLSHTPIIGGRLLLNYNF
jgi:hypothetical protein